MSRFLLLLLLSLPLTAYAAQAPATLAAVHTEARSAWELGDADRAAAIARSFLNRLDAIAPGAEHAIGIRLRCAHFGDAPARAHGVLPADPDTVERLVDLGWWLARAGDPRRAVDLLEAVLAVVPDHAEAHLVVAEARAALGDHADARRHAEAYLALTAPRAAT